MFSIVRTLHRAATLINNPHYIITVFHFHILYYEYPLKRITQIGLLHFFFYNLSNDLIPADFPIPRTYCKFFPQIEISGVGVFYTKMIISDLNFVKWISRYLPSSKSGHKTRKKIASKIFVAS